MLTSVPTVGQVIGQGQSLYAVNGTPAVLLYGSTPAWRTLSEGVTGLDVAELNADLVALGEATTAEIPAGSDSFGSATATAVKKLQATLGAAQTGSLTLGQVTFLPTPVRVTTLNATLGSPVPGGPLLTATSTTRQVTATLDASQLSAVKTGDHVTIGLPGGQGTPGVVASIGRVATAPSGTGSSSGPPTVDVDITPADPAATGNLDRAPVTVAVTIATVPSALAVPVAALVTTSTGQPAVNVVQSDGTTQEVPVTLGLFDDANGLIEIHATALTPGQRVRLPANNTA